MFLFVCSCFVVLRGVCLLLSCSSVSSFGGLVFSFVFCFSCCCGAVFVLDLMLFFLYVFVTFTALAFLTCLFCVVFFFVGCRLHMCCCRFMFGVLVFVLVDSFVVVVVPRAMFCFRCCLPACVCCCSFVCYVHIFVFLLFFLLFCGACFALLVICSFCCVCFCCVGVSVRFQCCLCCACFFFCCVCCC